MTASETFTGQRLLRLVRCCSVAAAFALSVADLKCRADSEDQPPRQRTTPSQPAPSLEDQFERGIRQKALDLDIQREQTRQLEATLAIRERVNQLESQRRRDAAAELDQLRSKRESLEKRIDYARRSVLQSFDVYDRGLIPTPTPSATPSRRSKRPRETSFERSNRLRAQMLHRLLVFRGESAGLIANGDALNFFVELCGPSAFAHTFVRAANPQGKAPNPDDAFLSQITDQFKLPPDVLRHIRYQRGMSGPKLSGRLNQDPLDVNWPAILKRSLRNRTDDIERRREQVLKELRQNRPVPPEIADALLDAVRDLLTAIYHEEESLMQEIRRNGRNTPAQADWLRYHAAEAPVRVLLAGAYRLIEAREIADVSLPPLNVKNGVTVENLLTYMHENNLRFSPADLNGQPAYNSIFELMSRYYIDLSALKLETVKNEQRVEVMHAQEAQVKEVMLGNQLDNVQRTEIEVARLKASAAMSAALLGAISSGARGP